MSAIKKNKMTYKPIANLNNWFFLDMKTDFWIKLRIIIIILKNTKAKDTAL